MLALNILINQISFRTNSLISERVLESNLARIQFLPCSTSTSLATQTKKLVWQSEDGVRVGACDWLL